jgi:WD40 repeat protein/serine/threonine protein kinase
MSGPVVAATCPACGLHSASVPAALVGREVRCTRCKERFTIAAPDAAPPAATQFEDAAPLSAHAATQWEEEALPAEPAPTSAEDGEPEPAPTALEAEAAPGARPAASAAPAAPGEWRVGDVVLDLYDVTGVLGQGGMGRVYRVRHRAWDVDLAVKTPLPSALRAAGGAEAFEREAETWVGLGLHPHTVSCYYVRRVDGLPRVFAEFVDGGSLHDWIRQRRLTTVERILDIAIQFAWGLHYAHEQGLVHCDVKPANVMITADGVAKVTDFGLARGRAAAGPGSVAAPMSGGGATLVVAGSAAGTPAYMSPEQSAGRVLTRRTDLWSWALSLLEMFRGERTWEFGVAAQEVLQDYLDTGGKAIGLPAMPHSVVDLLAQCFREDPEARPRTLWDAAAALYGAYQDATSCAYARAEPQGGRETAGSLSNRAVSLLDLGRVDEAAKLWERALRAEPSHPEATYNQTLHAWRRGQVADDEAMRRVEEAGRAQAGRARAAHLAGQLLLGLGETTAAARKLSAAAAAGGVREAERDAALAVCALGPGATSEQRAETSARLESVLHASPDDRVARAAYVVGLQHTGQTDDAQRAWAASGAPPGVTPEALLAAALPGFDRAALLRGPGETLRAIAAVGSLVIASDRDTVRMWNPAAGSSGVFQGRELHVRALLASPDGRIAVAGGEDGALTLWDLASGRMTRTLTRVWGAVYALVPASGGRLVVAGSDRTVRVVDGQGRVEHTLAGHGGAVNGLTVSADGRFAASGANDGSVFVWDLASGAVVARPAGHTGSVNAVAFAGERLVSAGDDRLLRVWDAGTGRALGTWAGHTQAVASLVTLTRERLLSAGLDRTLRIWDLSRGEVVAIVRLDAPVAGVAVVGDLAWSASGKDVVGVRLPAQPRLPAYALARPVAASEAESRNATFLGRIDSARESLQKGDIPGALNLVRTARSIPGFERAEAAVQMWDDVCTLLPRKGLQASWEAAAFEGHTDPVLAVAVSGDGRVLSGGMDQTVRLWDLARRQPLSVLKGHAEAVTAVAFTPDGRLGVSASWDRTAYVWDLAATRVVRSLEGHEEYVTGVSLSPDGAIVLTSSWDQTLRTWNVATGRPLRVLQGHEGNVSAVAFGPDGRFSVSGGWDHTVRAWDMDSGECAVALAGHEDNVSAVAVAAGGRQIASGSADHSVRLWDLRSRRPLRVLTGHQQEVTAVVFSPDGRFLASGSRDKTVRVWDLTTGQVARTLDHTAAVLGLAFGGVGTLVTAGADRVVRAWHLDWEPDTRALPPWDEKARPFLESFVSLRASTLRSGAASVSDRDVDTVLQDLRRRGFGGLTRASVASKLRDLTERPPATTYWDDVRKSAPRSPALPPRPSLSMKKILLGAAAVAVLALGIIPWVHVKVRPHLLPYMQKRTRNGDPKVMTLKKAPTGCSDDYGLLTQSVGEWMTIDRLSCLAQYPVDRVTADLLMGLALSDPDPTRAQHRRWNVLAYFAFHGDNAVDPLCAQLGNPSQEVRHTVGTALGIIGTPKATQCVIDTLVSGEPTARVGAAATWRRTLASGHVKDGRAWEIESRLLADPEPLVRLGALQAIGLFHPDAVDQALPPLLADSDAVVKAAAEAARDEAAATRRWIRLFGEDRT